MTHTHAKGQGQRSFSSKVRVETDRRKEVIAIGHVVGECDEQAIIECCQSRLRHTRLMVVS